MDVDSPERGTQTRAEILDAAYTLISEQGYHGTSMRQIAARAGIALGGFYNHFASKEAVFHALIMERNPYRVLIPALEAAQGDTIEACVRDAAARMDAALAGRYDFLNLLFIEIVEFNGRHLGALFQQQMPNGLRFFLKLQGLEGELRPIPLPIIMRGFMGTFFSFVLTEKLVADYMPPEMRADALQMLVGIYLHGVLKPGETPAGDES